MNNKMKKLMLNLICLGGSLMSLNSFAGMTCNLGETCNVPNLTDSVTYQIKRNSGTTYTCELNSKSKHKISVVIRGENGFDFHKVFLSAHKEGTKAVINGTFKKPGGDIVIHQTTSIHRDGTINCRPGG